MGLFRKIAAVSTLGASELVKPAATVARKATKTVVYTAVPIAGPIKAAAVGTRSGNLKRKEMRKQTKLLEEIARKQ
jgi:hypothetical protein